MADKVISYVGSDGENLPVKAVDLGDGTFGLATIAKPPALTNCVKLTPVGGNLNVTFSGTAEPLAAVATPVRSLVGQARSNNVGVVCFGDSTVDKTTSRQMELDPGQPIIISAGPGEYIDLAEHYIDADNSGDGIQWLQYA